MAVILGSSWLRHTSKSAALRIALGSNSGAFICFYRCTLYIFGVMKEPPDYAVFTLLAVNIVH